MNRFKYPRTLHLPWSPGITSDDVRHVDASCFEGKNVIVTEKMDGENTTMYSDYIHARSITSQGHASRDWVKNLHARLRFQIPVGFRVCGENLYARHSIPYEELASYFYLFSVWNEQNKCLSWSDTIAWSLKLEVPHPKVLYEGKWNEKLIKNLSVDNTLCEGYVVRLSEEFEYDNFAQSTAKWVRSDHLQTDGDWKHKKVIPNKLK